MSLSARATVASAPANGSLLWDVQADLWNPDSNPQGYVSLGMAENVLVQEALLKRVAQVPVIPATAFTYGDGTTGSKRLKNALGAFLTKHFHAYRRAFGNQDDFFLVGKPFFRAFVLTTGLRVATNLISVPCEGLDPFGIDVVQNYEREIVRAHGRGQKVAGIILCNPHNPLGRCYTRDAILGLMRLCQKHELHLISDEVYGLSTFTNDIDSIPPSTPFTSCLSVDTTNIVDPALIHVVWGVSKDFGSNGIRLAAVIPQENPALH
ncbi:putative aminotransferase tcpI [Colletotrichum fructicola]|uniref:Aspartate aminotransferase n=1 Tax=Colletotrichum fructicola (strain Nara gc5) TaxID=1213859 RepID=L2G6A8_COLFN|nr:putative aminotransferase tcpI [Colletotrichum fructicola]KAF4911682.1 putative aminotransferase tcpI [Colletotrichum fructicola]KAF4942037.1 putative aminotransferase tcpI [Colletotrichum fructicola]